MAEAYIFYLQAYPVFWNGQTRFFGSRLSRLADSGMRTQTTSVAVSKAILNYGPALIQSIGWIKKKRTESMANTR